MHYEERRRRDTLDFTKRPRWRRSQSKERSSKRCANDNGRCCNHYNKREDSHRTTLIILLKTPYAIGTIAALFLHLLLPEDRVIDEEKEHYPRAFSDGEIAYES